MEDSFVTEYRFYGPQADRLTRRKDFDLEPEEDLMSAKGMRCKPITTGRDESVHVYSDASTIMLQLRKRVETEVDVKSPSFKVALELNDSQAIALATELVSIVCGRQTRAAAKDQASA